MKGHSWSHPKTVGAVVLAGAVGLAAMFLFVALVSQVLSESGRDRPTGVARIDGRLVIIQKVCDGETVATARVLSGDIDNGHTDVESSVRARPASARKDGTIRVPIEVSDRTWTVRGEVGDPNGEHWVEEVLDDEGVGFALSVLPFVPAKIPEDMVRSSDAGLVAVGSWTSSPAKC